MGTIKLELRNLSKAYSTVRAVDSVNFVVQEGELLGLLGPSGGGKTTVLRMIAGLEIPSAGDILIDGIRVNDVPVQERNIGFVFQHYALFKHMTVFQNVAFGLKIRKWRPQPVQARVSELLELLGLHGLHARYPHQLSGGQRQRVAIARGLAPKPKLLLLDEPFGAVDAKVRQELREWLIRLHDELNVTSLFVTHDQEEAMEVSDRIIVINKGRLEQIGPPSEIYEEPATEFVARFIGVMNIVEAEVKDEKARAGPLEFTVAAVPDGTRLLIGFRPYAVRLSNDPSRYPLRAIVKHVYFLGVAYRVEIQSEDGTVLRSRLNKEEYQQYRYQAGEKVSFVVTQFRMLPSTPKDTDMSSCGSAR
jgi:sulfate transport system ATP-binding protein